MPTETKRLLVAEIPVREGLVILTADPGLGVLVDSDGTEYPTALDLTNETRCWFEEGSMHEEELAESPMEWLQAATQAGHLAPSIGDLADPEETEKHPEEEEAKASPSSPVEPPAKEQTPKAEEKNISDLLEQVADGQAVLMPTNDFSKVNVYDTFNRTARQWTGPDESLPTDEPLLAVTKDKVFRVVLTGSSETCEISEWEIRDLPNKAAMHVMATQEDMSLIHGKLVFGESDDEERCAEASRYVMGDPSNGVPRSYFLLRDGSSTEEVFDLTPSDHALRYRATESEFSKPYRVELTALSEALQEKHGALQAQAAAKVALAEELDAQLVTPVADLEPPKPTAGEETEVEVETKSEAEKHGLPASTNVHPTPFYVPGLGGGTNEAPVWAGPEGWYFEDKTLSTQHHKAYNRDDKLHYEVVNGEPVVSPETSSTSGSWSRITATKEFGSKVYASRWLILVSLLAITAISYISAAFYMHDIEGPIKTLKAKFFPQPEENKADDDEAKPKPAPAPERKTGTEPVSVEPPKVPVKQPRVTPKIDTPPVEAVVVEARVKFETADVKVSLEHGTPVIHLNLEIPDKAMRSLTLNTQTFWVVDWTNLGDPNAVTVNKVHRLTKSDDKTFDHVRITATLHKSQMAVYRSKKLLFFVKFSSNK